MRFHRNISNYIVLLVTFTFFATTIWRASQVSLDVDELYEVTLTRQSFSDLIENYRVSSQLTHIILTKLLAAGCEDIICLRMGSIIAGTLSIPLIYILSRQLTGTVSSGIYSALLLSIAAVHLRYSIFIRGYSLVTFLALVSLVTFWLALQTNRRVWWILFSIAAVLNIYNHIFSALLMLSLFAVLVGWGWPRRNLLLTTLRPVLNNILLATTLPALFLVPMAILLATHQNDTDNVDLLFSTDWPTSFPPVSFDQPLQLLAPLVKLAHEFTPASKPPWLTALLIAFLFTGIYTGLKETSRRTATILLVVTLLLPPLLLSTASTVFQPWFWAFWRFVIFVIVPFIILAGTGLYYGVHAGLKLSSCTIPKLRKPAQLLIPLFFLLPVIFPALITLATTSPPYTNSFQLARKIHQQANSNDIILCVPDADWRITGARETCTLTMNLYTNLSSKAYYLDQIATFSVLSRFLAVNGRCVNRYVHLPHPEFKIDCSGNNNLPEPDGIWLVLWRNRDVSYEKSTKITISGSQRVEASDIIYIPTKSGLDTALENAGKIAISNSSTPLRKLENAISLATIHLAAQNIPQALSVLDEAIFTSRWPEATARLTDLQAQLSYLPRHVTPQRRLNTTWNDQIQLVGIDHLPEQLTVRPGTPLQVTFYWQAEPSLTLAYQVLLHLVDQQNRPVAVFDFQPFDGHRPMTDWPAGQTIRETRMIDLPDNLPPGRYSLVTGFYQPDSLIRLPIGPDGTGELATLSHLFIP